jgi:hypothetical protein
MRSQGLSSIVGRLNRSLRAPLALALLAAAALALAACGGGEDAKLLPGTTANQINANLDQVRRLVEEEDCIGAENAAASVDEEIEALEDVDAKLQRALREGAERLNVVVGECEEEAALEEEAEALEEAEAAEREEQEAEPEKTKKPPKHKAEKEVEEEVPSENEGPTLPPNSNGKGDEEGKGEGPPVEAGGGSSGGIGPGSPVEGD